MLRVEAGSVAACEKNKELPTGNLSYDQRTRTQACLKESHRVCSLKISYSRRKALRV